MSKTLTEKDYQDAATLLEISIPTIKAVAEVEASNGGFLQDGRPKILFEAHIFSRYTDGRFNESHPGLSSPKWNKALYGSPGAHQHDRFEAAEKLNRRAAIMASSWGMFQIMGFNHKIVGFADPQDFVNAMWRSERAHLMTFVEFIKKRNLADELQRRDWAAFAASYNGPGYKENRYDEKMAAAYAKHNEAFQAVLADSAQLNFKKELQDAISILERLHGLA